jgi:hypothetical protein
VAPEFGPLAPLVQKRAITIVADSWPLDPSWLDSMVHFEERMHGSHVLRLSFSHSASKETLVLDMTHHHPPSGAGLSRTSKARLRRPGQDHHSSSNALEDDGHTHADLDRMDLEIKGPLRIRHHLSTSQWTSGINTLLVEPSATCPDRFTVKVFLRKAKMKKNGKMEKWKMENEKR